MSQDFTADSVTAVLALVGVTVEPTGAANVAKALNTKVSILSTAFAGLPFEAEPASYLRASAEDAP